MIGKTSRAKKVFQQLALEAPNRAVEKRCHGIATFLCKVKENMCVVYSWNAMLM